MEHYLPESCYGFASLEVLPGFPTGVEPLGGWSACRTPGLVAEVVLHAGHPLSFPGDDLVVREAVQVRDLGAKAAPSPTLLTASRRAR